MKTIVSSLLFSLLIFIAPTHQSYAASGDTFATLVEQAFTVTVDNTPVDYAALEKGLTDAIAQDPSLKQAAPTAAMHVAHVYLENGRIQEAIWALDKGGLYAQAEALTQKVEDFFKNGEIIFGQAIGKGVSGSSFGRIGHVGIVIKPRDQKLSSESEVWTYQLDRMLGFNLVPIAVKRHLKNMDYSIHMLIPGAKDSGLSFRDGGYRTEYADFYFLDFIIDNVDRHMFNSMFAPSRQLFAIDHGRVYGTAAPRYSGNLSHFDSKFVPSPQIYQNIKNAHPEQLQALLRAYAPADVVTFISARLAEVQNKLPVYIGPEPIRPLSPEERIKGIKYFKKMDVTKFKTEQKKKQTADFKEGLATFKNFKVFQSKEEIVYTKIDGNTLTETGHKVLALIIQSANYDIPDKDVIILKAILAAYSQKKLGYRDVRRLYAELLKQSAVSDNFIKLTQSRYRDIAPINVFFGDPDFQKKYTSKKNNSAQFIENYEKVGRIVGPLACQYVYR